jgi:5'-nucleotidase / UDP-sugar diphosphatase
MRSRVRTESVAFLAVLAALGMAACGHPDDGAPPDAVGGALATADALGLPSRCGRLERCRRLALLHTNDLHSHVNGHAPEIDYSPAVAGNDQTIGGFARLAARVDRERGRAAQHRAGVLVLDAGDFTMGTAFEMLGPTLSPELTLMSRIGYDATTIGNHEFDWTPRALAGTLAAAAQQGSRVAVLASNMQLSATDPRDDELAQLVAAGVIRSKLVKEVGGLRVGLFGLLGADAVAVTPTIAPVTFEAIATAAARMVNELRTVDNVDLVVALSHSGINSDGSGEDAALAAAVPGIDVIVSGHTHASLAAPVVVGSTLIVTAGANGSHLGRLVVDVPERRANRPPRLVDYQLIPLDDSVKGSAPIQTAVNGYITTIDQLVAPAGLTYRKELLEVAGDVARAGVDEWPIGNLVTDAYRVIVGALDPGGVEMAFDVNGQIRAPLVAGIGKKAWFADLFRVVPLGIGPDALPGFPLVTFYVHGKDLRSGLELSAAKDLVGGDSFLQISGLRARYNPALPPFGRVTGADQILADGTAAPINLADTSHCYKVTTTLLVGLLLGRVSDATGGALSVTPKLSDCVTPATNLAARIVDAAPGVAGLQELKHWQALVGLSRNFPDGDGDGVAELPPVYQQLQGRWLRQ